MRHHAMPYLTEHRETVFTMQVGLTDREAVQLDRMCGIMDHLCQEVDDGETLPAFATTEELMEQVEHDIGIMELHQFAMHLRELLAPAIQRIDSNPESK